MKKLVIGVAALCLMASFAAPSFANDGKAAEKAAKEASTAIKSKAITGEVPLDPNSHIWDDVSTMSVGVGPQNMVAPGLAEGTIDNVKVKSVHNGKDIAFLLTWRDQSDSDTETMMDRFSDACAIMFPVKHDSEPSFMMGDPENPVQIVYWKAAWQKDIERGHYQDVRDAYPNYNYDTYPLVDTMIDAHGNKIVIKDGEIYKPVDPQDRAINTPIEKYTDAQKGFLPGLAVGNPRSRIDRTTPVEELNAIGFGSLTTQKGDSHANGKGVRSLGYWKVVITHPLKAYSEQDATLEAGSHTIAAIAVWDGGNKNRGGRKHFSNGGWVPLYIE